MREPSAEAREAGRAFYDATKAACLAEAAAQGCVPDEALWREQFAAMFALAAEERVALAVAAERTRAASVCARIAHDYSREADRQEGLFAAVTAGKMVGANKCEQAIRAGTEAK